MSLRSRSTLLAPLLAFGLIAAACGGDDDDTATVVDPATDESMADESMTDDMADDEMSDDEMSDDEMSDDEMMEAGATFGDACSAVPTDGEGSLEGMADDPVATAASNNPVLSTLVTAVGQAGLVDTLNSGGPWTVFAPANDAFAAIPAADMDAVMADTELLSSILTYHVIEGQIAPEDLAGTHTTVNGADLEVTGGGEDFMVNDANVICGNVQTANATVYIIDTVLMPSAN